MDTKLINQIPGYIYNEYMVVLKPNEDVSNKIGEIRKTFSGKFKTTLFLNSRIDIPLVNFVQFEMREKQIVNSLKAIADRYRPFKVNLKDYCSFPAHTIFINIESKQQVLNLVKELKSAQHWMHLDKQNKAHFIDNPFITIAAKLLPWQFEKGWLEYKNHYFTASFMTEEMVLLKRRIGTKKFQNVMRFQFTNSKTQAEQAELFI